jgi:electron transport complex protein RnfE
MKSLNVLLNGIVRENPLFVSLLGLCPTLGTTATAINGFSMGLATTFVLICSNITISLLKNLIPDQVRIPAFIILVAAFVTIIQLTREAYTPALYESLGLFIPLIVVNCIIFSRVESFASKNNVFLSMMDGLGMGLGFTLALTILGMLRELLGTGKLFGAELYPEHYGSLLFILAPGGFIVLGYLIAIINKIKTKS